MSTNKNRWIKDETAKHWIVIDRDGQPYGRFHSTAPLSETVVFKLACSLLPELPEPQIISWNRATPNQRMQSAQYKPFTPLMCAKLGIRLLPEPPPAPPPPKPAPRMVEGLPPYRREPSLVGRWAGKLQKRFMHAGGGAQ